MGQELFARLSETGLAAVVACVALAVGTQAHTARMASSTPDLTPPKQIEMYLKADPLNQQVRSYFAQTLLHSGDPVAARVSLLDSISALDRDGQESCVQALISSGQSAVATARPEASLALQPNDVRISVRLANLYVSIGQGERDCQVCRQAMQRTKNTALFIQLNDVLQAGAQQLKGPGLVESSVVRT